MTPTRLYRPQPPEFFAPDVVASLDVENNIVHYNREVLSLTTSKHLGMLSRLDQSEALVVAN